MWGGFFYSANRFCAPDTGGTHLDAPIHFARDRMTVDRLLLGQLVAPAVRIDVREQSGKDRGYRLWAWKISDFKQRHGRIQPGTIVLAADRLKPWYWPDRKQYLGSESLEDAMGSDLPSHAPEAARLLVEERRVALLGVDTASIDTACSKDFLVHRIAAARQRRPGSRT